VWGERIAASIHAHAPAEWHVETWTAPRVIPPVVDYPEDYLPGSFEPADLVVSLGETAGLAQLVPDIVRRRVPGGHAPVDFRGAARQLRSPIALGQASGHRLPIVLSPDGRRTAELVGANLTSVIALRRTPSATFKISPTDGSPQAQGCGLRLRASAPRLIGLQSMEAIKRRACASRTAENMNKDRTAPLTADAFGDYLRGRSEGEIRPFLTPVHNAARGACKHINQPRKQMEAGAFPCGDHHGGGASLWVRRVSASWSARVPRSPWPTTATRPGQAMKALPPGLPAKAS
jgi:hypothetical protein